MARESVTTHPAGTAGAAGNVGSTGTGAAAFSGPFQVTRPNRANRWLNLMVFGAAGTGKTFLAGTAEDVPEMRDVLYIDAEGGDLTLQNRPGLHVIRVGDYRQLARVEEYLRAHARARDAGDRDRLRDLHVKVGGSPDDEPPQYRTIVLDSVTEISKYCLWKIQGISIMDMKMEDEPTKPGFDEWNSLTEMVRRDLRKFRDLPYHIIFTALEQLNREVPPRLVPAFPTQKLCGEVPAIPDVVGRLVAGVAKVDEQGNTQRERRLMVEEVGSTPFIAKNRLTAVGPYIANPTMRKIYDLMVAGDR